MKLKITIDIDNRDIEPNYTFVQFIMDNRKYTWDTSYSLKMTSLTIVRKKMYLFWQWELQPYKHYTIKCILPIDKNNIQSSINRFFKLLALS